MHQTHTHAHARAGNDPDISTIGERAVYAMMLLVGVVVIAILIGLITDSVQEFMASLGGGRTKVAEKGHTLIMGWNESTPRLICQICFLRQAWRRQTRRGLLPSPPRLLEEGLKESD